MIDGTDEGQLQTDPSLHYVPLGMTMLGNETEKKDFGDEVAKIFFFSPSLV